MPFPTARVVPEGWAARHRPIIAGFFVDRVTLERKTGQVTTDDLGTETPVWELLTPAGGVPALIQVVHSTALDERDASGKPIVLSDYYGRVDVEWLPEDGDRLTVLASPDPANVGVFYVQRVESQGHVVDRTMHLSRVS